jgi:MATE family multidrug resistance protein
MWLAVVMGCGAFFSLRYAPLLLERTGVQPELIPTTTGFLKAIAWGAPGLCIFQVLRSYSEGISLTRPVMYTSVGALIANIFGDYIFMYVGAGNAAVGCIGCGVASAIVMWMNATIMLAYIPGLIGNTRRMMRRQTLNAGLAPDSRVAAAGLPMSMSFGS